ncbi:hypothetical protein HGA88_03385 [Candidatus Roizmanbacteria bacterium]|nr:hypothetical protein [Candidatus Roizmanbacteria bacterium]
MIDETRTIFQNTPPSPETEKLERLVSKSARVLMKIKTTFPFNFFPTTVSIDENKISIVTHSFFSSGRARTISVKDMKDVMVDTDLFYGALTLKNGGEVEISFLKKSEALMARQLILGLIFCYQDGVDPILLTKEELIAKAEKIGELPDQL